MYATWIIHGGFVRNTYLNTLFEIARKDRNVLAIIGDNGIIVYDRFRAELPEQYYNFGIAEANMVTTAAGLASCGKIPFVYTIGNFLSYRAYESIRIDVCLQNLNVNIVGIGAGLTYSYHGPTHHTTEDISALRVLPNLTLFSPATARESKEIVEWSYRHNGPVYIRLGNNLKSELYEEDTPFEVGRGSVLREGEDIAVFVTGDILYEAVEACDRLKHENGVSAAVISMHTIKPFDSEIVCRYAQKCKMLFSVEEHSVIGGLGGAVAEVLSGGGYGVRLERIGLEDCFAKGYGTLSEMRKMNGIDAESIYNKFVRAKQNGQMKK
jgi:transketolase